MRKGRVGIHGWLLVLPPLVAAIAGCSDCGCEPPPVVVPDTAAPKVASTDPACAASGIAVGDAFTVTFDEAMDSSSLDETSIVLRDASNTRVEGTVTPSASSVTFTPDAALAAGSTFRLTVSGVRDTAGNVLAAPFACRFTTAGSDTTAPVVESSTPACGPGVVGVSRNASLAVVFDEALAESTISSSTVFLRQAAGTDVPGTPSLEGRTVVFDPAGPLPANSSLTLTITVGVTDADESRTPLAANFVCTFTTSAADPGTDTAAPTVGTIVAPACGSTGAALNTGVRIPFSEAMDPASLASSITLADAQSVGVAGSVDASGATARFVPDADLAPSTAYTLRVGTGARDLAGNALAAQSTCTFTTGSAADTTAPSVSSTDPADAETGVCLDPAITATLSEDMDPATLTAATFTVEDDGGAAVAGSVSFDSATDTATFTPSAALAPSTTFTAAISAGARDLAGNGLSGGTANPWTFTTGTAACAP